MQTTFETFATTEAFDTSLTTEYARAIPGAVFHFLATGKDTDGAFALMHMEVERGTEPPLHVHANEDENYFVLEGEIRYFVGDRVIDAKAGDFVHLPKGIPHTFEVLSGSAKELLWLSPAGMEQFFWDRGVPTEDMKPLPIPEGPMPKEAAAQFLAELAEYGVEMVR